MLFLDDYVLESHARQLLQAEDEEENGQRRKPWAYLSEKPKPQHDERPVFEEMVLHGQRYLCQIPQVDTTENATTPTDAERDNEAEEWNELARATDRGLELLRDMEGECMYYLSGWWSYSFCYKNRIKQFHALPSGNGVPSYPPTEDPTTQSFILGRFQDGSVEEHHQTTPVELQTKGGSRYLVQRLEGGTTCDLTGRNRKIEVQFHCHPQTTDRIGWIKELTTCSYLMVVYTPRLCNDVAFLPPQKDDVYPIECREILSPQDVPDWEALHNYQHSQRLVDSALPEHSMIGGIAVGAQNLVGMEGRQIERGRVASIGDGRVEILANRENGKLVRRSSEELRNFDLDPEKVEMFKRQLEEIANGKDWSLEVSESQGNRVLRYHVEEGEPDQQQQQQKGDDGNEHGEDSGKHDERGSEETLKDEL